MWRILSLSLIVGFSPFILILVPAGFGLAHGSWVVFFVALIAVAIGLRMLYRFVERSGQVNMDGWLQSMASYDYKYAWDGSGIALDLHTRKVFLASRFKGTVTFKDYPLSDVRRWRFETPEATTQDRTLGHVDVMRDGIVKVGNEMATKAGDVGANFGNMLMAAEKTGLYVAVADAQYPEWFIKFKRSRDTKMELLRWNEVLEQAVNENGRGTISARDVPPPTRTDLRL